jgi:SAM-dependent methyltransferase
MRKPYKPEEYWQQRLSSQKLSIASIGYIGLGLEYNTWLYRKRFLSLTQGLQRLNIDITGKSLLDIGIGSGAYIPFWQKHGIASLTGLDITTISVNTLQQLYPNYKFFQGDVTVDIPHFDEDAFDIVTAFDILFHIVDDNGFSNSISNLTKLIKPGGWLLISDSFCSKPWGPIYHEYHRSYEIYQSELEKNLLKIVHLEPIFYTMMTPLCGSQAFNRLVAFEIRIVSKLGSHQQIAWVNHIIGAILFGIDTILSNLSSTGPGLKFIFIQKQISIIDKTN